MRTFVKRGALVCLLILAAPFVVILSRNPFLLLPLWLCIGYWAMRGLAPAARKPLAPAVAVITAQLAMRVMQVMGFGLVLPLMAFIVAQVLLLAWLVATGSRWAIGAAVVLELVGLGLAVPGIPRLIEGVDAEAGPATVIVAIGLYALPLAAIALLAPFLRPAPRAGRVAEVFE